MIPDQTLISIRYATLKDVPLIAAFNCAMALETEDKKLDQQQVEQGAIGMIADKARGFYLVAEYNGEVKACLMLTYEWSDWRNADFWWIQSVFVTPDARRQGLFKALYQQVKKLALCKSACGLRLYVEKVNSRAQHTYQSLGMSECKYLMFEESLVHPTQAIGE